MRVYIAGPLFSTAEREFNEKVARFLEELGYETFLPQRDGYLVVDLKRKGLSLDEINKKIFELDIEKIKESDIVLFLMDGRVPDEGACVEIGIAYALGKECIGLKTDPRVLMSTGDNPLIRGCLRSRIVHDFGQLEKCLSISGKQKLIAE